jgi:hypothetical protein
LAPVCGLQRLADQVVARGDRAARLLQFTGLGLGGFDEVLQRLEGRVGAHGEHRRFAQQVGHRRQVVQRDLGLAGGQRVGDPHAGDETQGVRVALLFRDGGGRHGAIAAGLVDDQHAHRQQLFFFKHLRHGAGQQVVATAGRGVHDHVDGFGRLPLGMGGACETGHGGDGYAANGFGECHVLSPCLSWLCGSEIRLPGRSLARVPN